MTARESRPNLAAGAASEIPATPTKIETSIPPCPECGIASALCDEHGCPVCYQRLDGCDECFGITWSDYVAAFPGADCEYEDCQHCTAFGCDACAKNGRVCGECLKCLDCAEPGEESSCTGVRWSRIELDDVEYHVPRLFDPGTQRWREQKW